MKVFEDTTDRRVSLVEDLGFGIGPVQYISRFVDEKTGELVVVMILEEGGCVYVPWQNVAALQLPDGGLVDEDE